MGDPVDYDKLAAEHGGSAVVDYDALAAQHGGKAVEDAAPKPSMMSRVKSAVMDAASTVGNEALGFVKGAGHTAQNVMASGAVDPLLGPGASLLAKSNAPYAAPALAPQPGQKLGYGGEQMLEYVLPGAVTGGLAPGVGLLGQMGMEALGSGAVAGAQTLDPKQAATAALIGAPGPLIGKAAEAGAPLVRKLAETQYGRALAATTKPLKAEAAKIIPQLLDRRVSGTLESLAEKGATNSDAIGKDISKAYEGATATGKETLTAPILQSLEDMKGKYFVKAGGKPLNVNPAAVNKISAVQDLVQQFGDAAEPDQLWALRKNMDDIIYSGGEVSPGTMKALQAQTRTVVQKELSKASPDIPKLNADFSLWKGLQKVASATMNRKMGQSGIVEMGLRTSIGGAAGVLLGGDDPKWGAVGAALGALTKHPLYRTVSAVEKARLASAMASGSAPMAMSVLTRLAAGLESGAADVHSDDATP